MNLINGETLEQLKLLDNNSIDLIITSPPYNFKNKGGDIKVEYDEYIDNVENKEYIENQIDVLNECFRVLKEDGSMFYNHKPRYENGNYIHPLKQIFMSNFLLHQEIIWDRNSGVDHSGNKFTPTSERIYWLRKKINLKKMENNHFILKDVWKIKPENNNNHPAPFPIEIPVRIIYSILDKEKDKTILDPYNGSGTTGIASKFFEHNYIGIDISESYIEMSKERIDNIDKFKDIIISEINLHTNPKNKYETNKYDNQINIFDIIKGD